MSRFASVKKAEASERGNYFPNFAMTYRVAVKAAKYKAGRHNTGFILEVINREVLVGETHEDGKMRHDQDGRTVPSVGETRSWFCNLSKDGGPPDLRRFCETVWNMLGKEGKPSDDEVEELCEHMISDEQPLEGVEFKLVTYNRKTQKGGPFTVHEWSPPPEDEDSDDESDDE